MSSNVLILPDNRICLFCNLRPKAGNDDLCDACSWRWLGMHSTVRPFVADPRDDRRRDDSGPTALEFAINTLLEKRSCKSN